MPWTLIAQLALQLGLPAVQFIIQKIEAGGNATAADVAQLVALAQRSASDRMLAVLTAQGIDPNSAQGKALLALAA